MRIDPTIRRGGGRAFGRRFLPLAVLAIFVQPFAARAASPSVTLTPSVPSPQMLGTPVTWTATVQNAVAGHSYEYRFSVTYGATSQIVSDFSPTATFTWVPHTVEGSYKFDVAARDITATPFLRLPTASVAFELLPRVTTPTGAAVNPTIHPLVALFSGPPCTIGHQLLVRFRPAHPTGTESPNSMTTNPVACSAQSANFYVAGMYPSSQYLMHWEEYSGTTLVNTGADLPFTTGAIPSTIPHKTFTVNVPAQAYDAAYPVLLFQTANPTAVDLSGNVLWYFSTNNGLTLTSLALSRIGPGGNFYSYPDVATLQQFDLAGNLVKQTNLVVMNQQLAAKGYPQMIEFNNHEVRALPDGNIGVLGHRHVVSTSVQGGTPTHPVTIDGDMVLVLDSNLQLVWAWDSFAHQDVSRAATDGDLTAGGLQDWTHTNALQGTADGNIIISERAQDMVLKINYANGKGDGTVLWKMGAGMDFTVVNPPSGSCGTSNLIPWFTHQHDAHFDFENDANGDGSMIMTVFDDGNTRHDQCPGTQNSRGMVLLVDEASRQVYIETLADLGGYSIALGSAQLLTPGDGNVYSSFDSGDIQPNGFTQVSEANLAGQIVYQMQTNQATYRAYRMANLYTPSEFEVTPPAGFEGALGPDQPFNFSGGFAQNQDALAFNGSAVLNGNLLRLTDGGPSEVGSIFYNSPVDVRSFTTDFTFQLTNPVADGFTFTIQNAGLSAMGGVGGYLGYEGIGSSVAIKFDLHKNSRDPSDNSTGLFVDGASPIGATSIDLTSSGIDLHSGDVMDAHITYDGKTLMLTLTDMVTSAKWSYPFTIDIPTTVGGGTAYVGFTGATGGLAATQQILDWSYESGMAPYDPKAIPMGSGTIALNGSAVLADSALQLTDGGANEASSAFFALPVNVQAFSTDFDFQIIAAAGKVGDGMTFTIQNAGLTALGSHGGGLGYAHIGKSVAVKFDVYNNSGEGSDSTGIFTDGAFPALPAIDLLSSGVYLGSGHKIHAHLSYDGKSLTLTLTDPVTLYTWSQAFAIDIPAIVGGNTAYVGFTAGTGSSSTVQLIDDWTFE